METGSSKAMGVALARNMMLVLPKLRPLCQKVITILKS